MNAVKPKKSLGQHFLRDKNIARKIVGSIDTTEIKNILEIGPGKGILTQYLSELKNLNLFLIEIDRDFIEELNEKYGLNAHVIQGDFLKTDINKLIQTLNDFGINV